jgi:hypothetical protein
MKIPQAQPPWEMSATIKVQHHDSANFGKIGHKQPQMMCEGRKVDMLLDMWIHKIVSPI